MKEHRFSIVFSRVAARRVDFPLVLNEEISFFKQINAIRNLSTEIKQFAESNGYLFSELKNDANKLICVFTCKRNHFFSFRGPHLNSVRHSEKLTASLPATSPHHHPDPRIRATAFLEDKLQISYMEKK